MADKFEIIEQLTRYHHAVDFKRWDDLDAILTEDCTASWPGLGIARGLSTDSPQGREEIRQWLRDAVGAGTSLHYMVNHVIDVDGDRATNTSMVAIGDKLSNLYHMGHYDGVHIRTPQGWRISSLQFTVAPAAKLRHQPPAEASARSANVAVVEALLHAFEALDLPACVALLSEDASYTGDPKSAPVTGRDAIRALWSDIFGKTHDYRVELRQITEGAGTVMVERDEFFTMAGRAVQISVVGVFEVKGGLVSAWREYWDMSALAAAKAE